MSTKESYGPEYHAQAQLISKLHAQNSWLAEEGRKLELKIQSYESKYADAVFYRHMTEAIAMHPALQDIWIEFVAMLRLCEPDLDANAKDDIRTRSITL